jgi:hypothetical protein
MRAPPYAYVNGSPSNSVRMARHAIATAGSCGGTAGRAAPEGPIYRKLGASSRSQAVTRSRELGLLEG